MCSLRCVAIFLVAVILTQLTQDSQAQFQEDGTSSDLPPYVVSNVSISVVSDTVQTSVLVSWDPPTIIDDSTANSPNITGYRIYYSKVALERRTSELISSGERERTVEVTGRLATSRVVGDLEHGATYQFQVIALVDGQVPEGQSVAMDDYHTLIATVNDQSVCISGKQYIKVSRAVGGIIAAIFCTIIAYTLVVVIVCWVYKLSHRSIKLLKKEVMRCDSSDDYQTHGEADSYFNPTRGLAVGDKIINPAFDTSIAGFTDQ